jgi:hypothetical protein
VYVDDELQISPPHLCLYLVRYLEKRWKQKGDSAGSRTRESFIELKYIYMGFFLNFIFSGARFKN